MLLSALTALVAILGAPSAPLAAQQGGPAVTPFDILRGSAASRGAEESEVFLSALRVIRDFSLQTLPDSALWDMAIDLDDRILTCSRGIHGIPMSEYALGAMLHFTKRFDQYIAQSRERRWQRSWLDELDGRTVMILGLGQIGGCIAERARAFGMRVLGVQRRPRPHPAADAVLGLDTFHDHLGEVDFLVVTVPRTHATLGMIDDTVMRKLKAGAVIVNLSRGGIVCETALCAALDAGHLRGAALDVFDTQPLPANSPLWDRPDVLLTPHVSGTSPRYLERALDVFLDNARRLHDGESAITPVDRAAGY
jgi:phosphoglycerate dehydrogenase-like enzyme